MENISQMPFLTFATFACGLVISLLLIGTTIAVYRLFLHPLAQFPGPKLAAVTVLYEAYYDVWKGGKYIFELNELHQRYGKLIASFPIVL